jgi:CRP-like cAMP-binding protein
LVTFIACEIVTGRGLRKFQELIRAGFSPQGVTRRGGGARTWSMLPCGTRVNRPDASFAPSHFPTNMARRTSQKAGDTMAIEKCINEFDVDDVIFEEGSTGRELFVVLEGKIDIVKINGASKTVIVTLGKGEFFGEMAVIDGSARSATAIAAAPHTRVMRINHARFVYLVSQQPAFALMIMDALSKRLRASNAVTFRAANP